MFVMLYAGRCAFSYQWLKNGAVQEPPPWNFLYIGKGTVRITQLTALDQGFYQCLASNNFGTAMSNVTFLQRAVLDSYSGSAVVEEKSGLSEGQPFRLECKRTKCVPQPAYYWVIADDLTGPSQTQIITDKRVQIDEEGEQSPIMSVRSVLQLQEVLHAVGSIYRYNH